MDEDRASRTQNRAAAAQRWRDWLVPEMERAEMRQIDVVRASSGQLQPAVVSKWVNGEFTASPDYAILAARILGADPLEALAAAGHHEIVATVKSVPIPGGLDDPVIAAVQGDGRLTPADKALAIRLYREDIHHAMTRARTVVDHLAATGTVRRASGSGRSTGDGDRGPGPA